MNVTLDRNVHITCGILDSRAIRVRMLPTIGRNGYQMRALYPFRLALKTDDNTWGSHTFTTGIAFHVHPQSLKVWVHPPSEGRLVGRIWLTETDYNLEGGNSALEIKIENLTDRYLEIHTDDIIAEVAFPTEDTYGVLTIIGDLPNPATDNYMDDGQAEDDDGDEEEDDE